MFKIFSTLIQFTRVYPKVSGLAAWRETANDAALCHYVQFYRYFVSQSSEFRRHNPLCCFSTTNTKGRRIFRYQSGNVWIHLPTGRGDYKWCELLHKCIGKNRSHHLLSLFM